MNTVSYDIAAWNTDLIRTINQGSGSLIKMLTLGVIAAVLATVGFSMLGSFRAQHRALALDHNSVPNKWHYVWIIVIALLAVVRKYYTSPIGIAITVVIIGLAIVSIILLFMWRKLGVLLSILFTWTVLVGGEIPLLLIFFNEYKQLDEYDLPNQYVIYAAARYTSTRIIAQAVLAMILTVIVIVYYGKRRMLFKGEQDLLKMANSCPKCGRVITSNYCPECGRDLREYKPSKLAFKILNTNSYCPDCGFELEDADFCPRSEARKHPVANTEESQAIKIKKHEHNIKENVKSGLSGTVKKFVGFIIAFGILFIPMLASDPMSRMSKGSAKIYNSVVESISEYQQKPSASRDEEWLAALDERCAKLYEKNESSFYGANLERLDYTELYQFINYFPQAYYQNSTLAYVQKIYHREMKGNLDMLYSKMDQINTAQIQALSDSISLIGYGKTGIFDTAVNVLRMFGDTVRGYFSFIGVDLFSICLGVVGLLSILLGAVLWLKFGGSGPFVVMASGGVHAEAVDRAKAKYKKQTRKEKMLSYACAVGLLIVCCGIASYTGKDEEMPGYSTAMETCYFDDGVKMMEWLSLAKTDPEQALAQKKAFMEAYTDWEQNVGIAQSEDNKKDYEEYPEVNKATDKLTISFGDVRNDLINDTLPDDQKITELAKSIKDGMEQMQQFVLKDLFDGVGTLVG